MFIEDEELRILYRDASRDHLDKLEAGVLHLEKHPDDAEQLKELLREAHSFKGDSRMLGVQDAETLMHQVEDLLIAIEKGECAVTAELCDLIYQGLDALKKIAHEAVTGEPSRVNLFQIMTQLMGVDDDPKSLPEVPAIFEQVNQSSVDFDEAEDHSLSDLETLASDQPYVPAGLDLSMLDPELAAELSGIASPVANGQDFATINGHVDAHDHTSVV
ncbi:Hpt domain-containing protein, partial [Acaryochloris marina NIES-2412]|uniref:Hpt domain-containing protein n=1 Tax=Acaryochloris marina TaxID=155978 RepID=UPI004058E3DA